MCHTNFYLPSAYKSYTYSILWPTKFAIALYLLKCTYFSLKILCCLTKWWPSSDNTGLANTNLQFLKDTESWSTTTCYACILNIYLCLPLINFSPSIGIGICDTISSNISADFHHSNRKKITQELIFFSFTRD